MAKKDGAITSNDDLLYGALRRYAQASLSQNSKRAYLADWTDFIFWCKRKKRSSLPASPDTVALYLTAMADTLKTSSLRRRLTAIKRAHEAARRLSPTRDPRVANVLRGIIRSRGEAQAHAAPTLLKHIEMMISCLPNTLSGARDKALILLGFAGGFRRSELVALDIEDLSIADEGLAVHIKRGKTDQTAIGRTVGITRGSNQGTCPIEALQSWLDISRISSGPLFRAINRWEHLSESRLTDQSVRLILKDALKQAGIPNRGFSGHSLRAGFVTVAALNGAHERDIMRSTGHRSLEVLRRYIRDACIFRDSASRKLGL